MSVENHGNEKDGILDIQIPKNETAKQHAHRQLRKAATKASPLKKPCSKKHHHKLQFAASDHDSHHSHSHSPETPPPEITEKQL